MSAWMLNNPWTRMTSLLLAAYLSVYILIFPNSFSPSEGQVDHSLLMLILAGVCIGFIHGVGFNPETKILNRLLGPIVCWPIMLFGLFTLFM